VVGQAVEIALYHGDGSEDFGFGKSIGFLNYDGHHDVDELLIG
jgi:hypothetical protein